METLRFLIASTRLEHGCEKCTVSIDSEFTVHYDERWATQADVRRHVRSSAFTSLLGLMECAIEPPDVQFDFITAVRGLDFVAELRGEAGDGRSPDHSAGRSN
jgi:quinol monooxygenase YgiN